MKPSCLKVSAAASEAQPPPSRTKVRESLDFRLAIACVVPIKSRLLHFEARAWAQVNLAFTLHFGPSRTAIASLRSSPPGYADLRRGPPRSWDPRLQDSLMLATCCNLGGNMGENSSILHLRLVDGNSIYTGPSHHLPCPSACSNTKGEKDCCFSQCGKSLRGFNYSKESTGKNETL